MAMLASYITLQVEVIKQTRILVCRRRPSCNSRTRNTVIILWKEIDMQIEVCVSSDMNKEAKST